MRGFALACTVVLLACSCTKTHKTPPQARPVATFLQAVLEEDMALWRSTFSSAQQARLDRKGLKSVFRGQRSYMTRALEEFDGFSVEDLAYSFSGDDQSGRVYMALGNRDLGEMRVVNEGGTWKLDEIDERK